MLKKVSHRGDRLWPAALVSLAAHALLLALLLATEGVRVRGGRGSMTVSLVTLEANPLELKEQQVDGHRDVHEMRTASPPHVPSAEGGAYGVRTDASSSGGASSAALLPGDGDGGDEEWVQIPGGFMRSSPEWPGATLDEARSELAYTSEIERILKVACGLHYQAGVVAESSVPVIVMLNPDGRISSWRLEADSAAVARLGLDHALRALRLPPPPPAVYERHRSTGFRVLLTGSP